MIPTLLWQCPLCHADDALRHQRKWFRPEEVNCTTCGTVWEVRRVIGNDYFLRVIHGVPSSIGCQMPLAQWYDLMKSGLRLAVQEGCPFPLEAGEELYVRSRQARLLVERSSPLFGCWGKEEAPWEREGDLGFPFVKRWDVGQLSLTSERLIWTGKQGTLTFWLRRVNSVHTEVTWSLGLLYGLCLYKFRFRQESILKWLTYIALVGKRIEQVHHHRISLSNY